MRSVADDIFIGACPTAHTQKAMLRGSGYTLLLRRKATAQGFSGVSAAIPHAEGQPFKN